MNAVNEAKFTALHGAALRGLNEVTIDGFSGLSGLPNARSRPSPFSEF
jgi:hypothetical protein